MAHIEKIAFFTQIPASFLPGDSGIETATLWDDGQTLWLVAGAQCGGWRVRERLWRYDRLPGGAHPGALWTGHWGGNSFATLFTKGLSVVGATLETTPRGWPLARVADGASELTVTLREEAAALPFAQFRFAGFEVRLLNAQNGEVLAQTTAGSSAQSITLALEATAPSAILQARALGVEQGYYSWPPPNYTGVTGESEQRPEKFAWVHPTRGKLFYDPFWRVGARPYDASKSDQSALLELEAEAIEQGLSRKHGPWVPYLVEFDSSGAPIREDGEWSLLRVALGDATWDENAVGAQAGFRALWRCPLHRDTLQPLAPFAPWNVDAGLRAVGALEIDPQSGALLVGGSCTGADGAIPALFQIQKPNDAPGDEAVGQITLGLFYCECVLPLGKSLVSIAKSPRTGEIRATSPCDEFTLDMARPLLRRLIPSHPGGRNALFWRNRLGENYGFLTEGFDFATRTDFPSLSIFIVQTPGGRRAGLPVAKHLDSRLSVYAGALCGVFDHDYQSRESQMSLGRSENGVDWSYVTSWNKAVFDGGATCRIGNKRDGSALWVFGTAFEAPLTKGRALRWQGALVTRHIECDFFIQRANTVPYRGEELGVCVGLRCVSDAQTGATSWPRVQWLLITRGLGENDGENPGGGNPDDPTNAREALELMPDGTRIFVTTLPQRTATQERDATLADEVVAIAHTVRHRHEAGEFEAWDYATQYPHALWFRADGDAPFGAGDEPVSAQDLTGDQLAALAQFDQRGQSETDRFLAIAATQRVEAVFLLAPDWAASDDDLRATF